MCYNFLNGYYRKEPKARNKRQVAEFVKVYRSASDRPLCDYAS